MRTKKAYLLLLTGILLSPFVCAQPSTPSSVQNQDSAKSLLSKKLQREYIAYRLIGCKPKIDGHLNDSCWKVGEWAGNFTQWTPSEGARPSQSTYIKILYDNRNIYVGIRAVDHEPGKIQRIASRRDEQTGDVAGVTFDSYHDKRTGFEFDVTAAGQQIDMLVTSPWNFDTNWNAVWYSKVAVEDTAWTAEIAIPFSQLRYSKERQQTWGLHCWRWINRLKEESDWEPQSSTSAGILYLFGNLKGLNDLPHTGRFEMIVSGLSKLSAFRKDPGNPFAAKGYQWNNNLGLDAKIGITSNFTINMTLNPDFGQVEADPSVMNLTAYETYFDEKRPFFLEGKNIFAFDMDDVNMFYSRRIGHAPSYTPSLNDNEYLKQPENTTILDAVKLSGKSENGFTLGILQSTTSNENATIASAEGVREKVAVEPLTNYFMLRMQQDLNQGNTVVGGEVTSVNRWINAQQLDNLTRNAYTAGADLLHQWNDKEFYIKTQLIGSNVNGSTEAIKELQLSSARYFQRPDIHYAHYDSTRTSLSGWGGDVQIGKGSKGLWRYYTEVSLRSPGLELNDMGYMQTADIIKQKNYISCFVNKPVSIFRTYNCYLQLNNSWDNGLRYLSSELIASGYAEFLNKWSVCDVLGYITPALNTGLLRGGPAMLVPSKTYNSFQVNTDNSRNVSLAFNYYTIMPNKETNYSEYTSTLTVRPLNVLSFSLKLYYGLNRDNLQYVTNVTNGGNSEPILARIDQKTVSATFRADCNLSPALSLQYYGSPFSSMGRYSLFKRVADPMNKNYSSRFTVLKQTNAGTTTYDFDASGDGKTDFSISNPDFNFYQCRSNFVLRWEYHPGSQLYFVWSNDITSYINPGVQPLTDFFKGLSKGTANNILLVKLSYWFSI